MSLSLPVSPSGAPIDPLLVDRATGRQLAEGVRVVAGPAADARMRRRFERSSRSDRKHKEIAMSIVADVDPAPPPREARRKTRLWFVSHRRQRWRTRAPSAPTALAAGGRPHRGQWGWR